MVDAICRQLELISKLDVPLDWLHFESLDFGLVLPGLSDIPVFLDRMLGFMGHHLLVSLLQLAVVSPHLESQF